jgi:hypothetical protein
MYKMLKIGFILEYGGFASIIVTHVLHKKVNLTSAIEKKRRRGRDRRCNIAPCVKQRTLLILINGDIHRHLLVCCFVLHQLPTHHKSYRYDRQDSSFQD